MTVLSWDYWRRSKTRPVPPTPSRVSPRLSVWPGLSQSGPCVTRVAPCRSSHREPTSPSVDLQARPISACSVVSVPDPLASTVLTPNTVTPTLPHSATAPFVRLRSQDRSECDPPNPSPLLPLTHPWTRCSCPSHTPQHAAPAPHTPRNTLLLPLTHPATRCSCPSHTPQHAVPAPHTPLNTLLLPLTHPATRCSCPSHTPEHAVPAPHTPLNTLLLPLTHPATRCSCPSHTPQHAAPAPHTPLNTLLLPLTHPATRCSCPSHTPEHAAPAPHTHPATRCSCPSHTPEHAAPARLLFAFTITQYQCPFNQTTLIKNKGKSEKCCITETCRVVVYKRILKKHLTVLNVTKSPKHTSCFAERAFSLVWVPI